MVKRYSKEKINAIKSAIDDALAQGAKPIAAFDADGTLWNTDMGEYFFHYQVKNNLLPNLPKNPLDFYQELFDQDAKAAFLWLVQINKNRPLTEIRKWTQRAFDEFKNFPVFDDVLEIIHFLQTKKVKIYIVTASMKWAVEPAAKSLGLSADQIIGVTTKIVNELVTDEPEGIMTWQEGKATRILSEIAPHQPFFCAGNTMGDLALLEAATHLRLVNCALPPQHLIYESEQRLIEVAKARNWFYHSH